MWELRPELLGLTLRTCRIALPSLLAVCGVWLLVGCIYLPIPEHRIDSKQKDFRGLLGDADSRRPIRPRHIARADVVAMLGSPRFVTKDGRAIAYTLKTEHGLLIWPTCFEVQATGGRVYAVRLSFDDADLLESWQLVHADRAYSMLLNETILYDHFGIELLNKSGPELIWTEVENHK